MLGLRLEDFVGTFFARVLRRLNIHWEWYCVIGLVMFVAFLLTHLEARWVQFVMVMALVPNPGSIILAIAIATFTRWQITMRVAGWVGYALSLTIIVTHDGNRTLADVWQRNMDEIYRPLQGIDPAVSVGLALAVYALLLVAPVGLFFWTRWARIHPNFTTKE